MVTKFNLNKIFKESLLLKRVCTGSVAALCIMSSQAMASTMMCNSPGTTEPGTMVQSGEPVAYWDFNNGDDPQSNSDVVDWHGDHNGIYTIPGTDYQGIRFLFRGKEHPEDDSTSEWRYDIVQPMSHVYEYLKFYQPANYTHRYGTKIQPKTVYSALEWKVGDRIVNDKGDNATVTYVENDTLYISEYVRYRDYTWGNGRTITNLNSGAEFVSRDSSFINSNNKFSAMWQGDYANSGMLMELLPRTLADGVDIGGSQCRPTITASSYVKASGTLDNPLTSKSATCLSPDDNGKPVELVIERKRSSSFDAHDGVYRVWRKSSGREWQLIYANTELDVYLPENNAFDHGYVLGWANSGFAEDTAFYLMGWGLWADRPSFLP